MSDTQPNQQAIEAAQGRLYDRVFCPVFFHELKKAGVVPRSEAEALECLEHAARLVEMKAAGTLPFELEETEAPASELGQLLKASSDMLQRMQPQSAQDAVVKAATEDWLQDPEILGAYQQLVAAS